MKTSDDERRREARGRTFTADALSLGTTLAVGMAVFAFLGHYVDQRRGGGVFWTLCGMFTGLGFGAYEVWKMVRLLDEEASQSHSRDGKAREKTSRSHGGVEHDGGNQ